MPPPTQVVPDVRRFRVTRDPGLFQDCVVIRVRFVEDESLSLMNTIKVYLESKRGDKQFRIGWIRSMYLDKANCTLVIRTKIRGKYDRKRGRGPVRRAIGSLMPVVDQAVEAHTKLQPATQKITKQKLHRWQPKHQPPVRPAPRQHPAFGH